jgi:predicted nucleotidyltransferase
MNSIQPLELAARQRGLEFVVIGGFAVIEHGLSRTTTDFDILVNRADKQVWHEVLTGFGYTLDQEKDTFRQYSRREGVAWPIDLMLVNEETFRLMREASIRKHVQGAEVLLVSLEHLIALKLHALKHSNLRRFMKDFEDVLNLVQIHKINLHSPKIRDLFLKYGNEDLYQKICRASEAP